MKLHPIVGDGRRVMCGPAAIATVTGKPIAEVKEAIYEHKGVRYVCGMARTTLVSVLLKMGYTIKDRHYYSLCEVRPTLARWLRERPPWMVNKLCVLVVGNHYVTVKGRKLNDNHTMNPVFIRKAPHRRKRVKNYWVIEKP